MICDCDQVECLFCAREDPELREALERVSRRFPFLGDLIRGAEGLVAYVAEEAYRRGKRAAESELGEYIEEVDHHLEDKGGASVYGN